jgi:hypothetical protein
MLLLRDHKALSPSKPNQVFVDGQPNKAFRLARAMSAISGNNEVAEQEQPILAIGSYRHSTSLAKPEPTLRRFM